MSVKDLRNQYQAELPAELFAEIPKAVFAAIAVSALTSGGDYLDTATYKVAEEWELLHLNGIVPQKPGAVARRLVAELKKHREQFEEAAA